MLAWMFAGEPDRDFIRDLFELRGVIEPAAAEFAARRRTDEQLAVMAQALDADRAIDLALARSEEHTSELQSLMRISYAVFCLKKKNTTVKRPHSHKSSNTTNHDTRHNRYRE